jgi:hypothetical protein
MEESKPNKFKKTGLLTKFSVKDIEDMIVGNPNHLRQKMFVPNVSWGFFSEHEADLVCFTNAGILTEYEIKRSWSDFLADFKKESYHKDNRIAALYYVVPEVMAESAVEYIDNFSKERYASGDYGSYYKAGVIGFTEEGYTKMVRECNYPDSNKRMYIENIVELERLGCLRYWDLRQSRSWHLLTEDNENDVYDWINAGKSVMFADQNEEGKVFYFDNSHCYASIGTMAKRELIHYFLLPDLN